MKIITMEIDDNGDATVETTGYKGRGCEAVQEVFTRALGIKVGEKIKPEYNQPLTNERLLKN